MSAAVLVQSRKELRALLPWWAAVAVATPLLAWGTQPTFPGFRYQEQVLGLFAYALGVMAVAAVAVGHELVNGTLASLLVQPVSRMRVLGVKLVVLAGALTAMGVVGAWAFGDVLYLGVVPRGAWTLIVWGPVVAGLGLVPLLTIASGRALGGIVFGILIPGIVFAICSWFIPDTLGPSDRPIVSPRVWQLTWLGTVALSAIGLATLAWMFPRWQAGRGGASPLAPALSSVAGSLAPAHRARSRHWTLLTIGKELRLQSMTLTLSAFFILGSLVTALVRYFNPASPGPSFEAMAVIHAACVCVMAGALSSAEERQLGTWASQVLSPRPFRRVWALKCATAIGLAMTLAIGVPLLLTQLDSQFRFDLDSELVPATALATVAAIYVSSLSTTGLSALIASVPFISAAMMAGYLLLLPILRSGERWLNAVAFDGRARSSIALARQLEDIVLLALMAAFAAVVLTFASRNHRTAERRTGTMAIQAAGMLGAAAVAAGLYILARAAIWTLTR